MDIVQRPETYFLQEAVNRGLDAIVARLDREKGYLPYFALHVLPELYLAHDIWDNGDMCARYTDAFILGRQVTGNTGYQDEELALNNLLHQCDPYQHPFMVTRVLITLVDEYLKEPDEKHKKRLDSLIMTVRGNMKYEKDYAYYFKSAEGWSSLKDPVFGDFSIFPTYPLGGIILALTRYIEAVYSEEINEFIGKLVKFITDYSGTFDKDGHYFGHTHSGGILTAAAGIIRWAFYKKDTRLINMMKGAFGWTMKYSSSWGWVPDGLGEPSGSCETCSITDALHFIMLMARYADPAYYETLERYARNQLLENQFKNTDILWKQGNSQQNEAAKNAAKALHGSWASWSLPNCLDNGLNMVEGCCLGSGIRGCYLVWNGAVEKKGGTVYVNMAFSRNSSWVEIISYQPYEGRVDIIVHDAEKAAVRIPSWVNKKDVRISVNNMPVHAEYANQLYVKVSGLHKDDHIKIQYPLRCHTAVESVNGAEYSVEWKGDTIVGITPKGSVYPLFKRNHMKENTAPMVSGQPYKYQIGGSVVW
ncbi:MAG: hypothetical protein FWD71_14050 [Oscillospiraceae bacterium]|nr:hypothetical protein [Oscillospiraceae bacterium]